MKKEYYVQFVLNEDVEHLTYNNLHKLYLLLNISISNTSNKINRFID